MSSAEQLQDIGRALGPLIGHRFDVIAEIEPGVPSPLEALSGDHTVGLYYDVIPLKMREHLSGFKEIGIGELLPKVEKTADGGTAFYLEAPKLRNVQFQAGWLQYLEESWLASVDEVKYPALEALGSIHFLQQTYGRAHVYLHQEIPMPLWIRPAPIAEALDPKLPQIVIQGRSLQQVIFTNIHTEVSMSYARQWADAVHGYYKKV